MDEHRGLPSRLEVIAVVDGIRFVDDALASNPFASRTGVESMRDQPLVLLAGGADRDVDVTSLATTIRDSDHVLRGRALLTDPRALVGRAARPRCACRTADRSRHR